MSYIMADQPKKKKFVIIRTDSKGVKHKSKESLEKAEAKYKAEAKAKKEAKKKAKQPLPKPAFKKSGVKEDMKKVGKANPRPPNVNSGQTRCYIRYNNQGRPYRICDDGKPKAGHPKPPDQITPLITPQEFLEERGKAYHELTDGQVREYHRLDMANRRKEEAQIKGDKGEERVEKWRAEKKQERLDWKNTRIAELEKIKQTKTKVKKKLRDEIKAELKKEFAMGVKQKIEDKDTTQRQKLALRLSKVMDDLKDVNDYLDNNPSSHPQYEKNIKLQIQLQTQKSELQKSLNNEKKDAKENKKVLVDFSM
jgi:hypothetical protein